MSETSNRQLIPPTNDGKNPKRQVEYNRETGELRVTKGERSMIINRVVPDGLNITPEGMDFLDEVGVSWKQLMGDLDALREANSSKKKT